VFKLLPCVSQAHDVLDHVSAFQHFTNAHIDDIHYFIQFDMLLDYIWLVVFTVTKTHNN